MKKHLLLVDDNPINLDLLKSFLPKDTYMFSTATSGKEAIAYCKDEVCDLILLDVMMPEMDGYETCTELKKIDRAKDIPVIFLTANNDHESVIKGFKSGGVDYVTKPYNSVELMYRINTHLTLRQKTQELEKALVEIEELAVTDPLTKVYNRLRFNILIEQQILTSERYNTPLSIIFVDIDHFKSINDTYGHLIGDEVLIKMAELIKSKLRNADIFARWGGEEFVMLLPETDVKGASLLAKKLKEAITSTLFPTVEKVTASLGVTQYGKDEKKEEFIHRADEAMYQAKRNGRNRVEVIY